MSETVARHRPSIDLDDFERRMRQSTAPQSPAHPQGAPYEDDPLAELARLVGEQHDPYGDVFAREAVAQPAHMDDRREPAFGRGVDFAAIEAGLRGALSAHPDELGHHDHHSHGQHGHDQHGYVEPTFEHDPYAEASQDWQNAAPRAQGKSRRPIYAMIATIAVGVIGIGVAFAFKGTSSSPREIKTIMAAAGPTKIQPPDDASADDASQTAGGIGKAQPAPTKLASGEEQPVDLSQAVHDNTARDAASQQQGAAGVAVPLSPGQMRDGTASPDYSSLGGTPNSAPSSDSAQGFGAGMPAPKKVKVVSVRPDGTIVSNDVGVPATSNDPMSLASTPSNQDVATQDAPKPEAPKMADKATKKSAKMTSRVTPKPVDINAAAANDDATPAPKPTKPAKKAKPTRVATADTGDQPAQGASAPEAEQTASSGGGFAVQFAAPTTEAEAKAASAKFGKKFASALDGRRLGFHKADSNGRSVYRVRSGGLSREEATSLCDKVKADGGSCFVAKS